MTAVGGSFLTNVSFLVRCPFFYRRTASQNGCRGIAVPCSGVLGVTSRAQQQYHSQSLNECVNDEIILMWQAFPWAQAERALYRPSVNQRACLGDRKLAQPGLSFLSLWLVGLIIILIIFAINWGTEPFLGYRRGRWEGMMAFRMQSRLVSPPWRGTKISMSASVRDLPSFGTWPF